MYVFRSNCLFIFFFLEIINSVTDLSSRETMCNNFMYRNFTISWTASTSPSITHYIVNCTSDTCMSVNTGATSVCISNVKCDGQVHIVNVYAVNSCGTVSTVESTTISCQMPEGN